MRSIAGCAVLVAAAVACGLQMSVRPELGVPGASSETRCPAGRTAKVTNPTPAAVNVFAYLVDAGGEAATMIGTVEAESTGEFDLSVKYGTSLRFEWVAGAEPHTSSDLSRVKYKIVCQTK